MLEMNTLYSVHQNGFDKTDTQQTDITDNTTDITTDITDITTYSLDDLAELLSVSTKTIYRVNGYFQRICECWYWMKNDFKIGNQYTDLALEKMIELQSALANKVAYNDFKKSIWQSKNGLLTVNNSNQIQYVEIVDNAVNESEVIGNNLDTMFDSLDKLGEVLGHKLAAKIGGKMVKTFNTDMNKIMEKLSESVNK